MRIKTYDSWNLTANQIDALRDLKFVGVGVYPKSDRIFGNLNGRAVAMTVKGLGTFCRARVGCSLLFDPPFRFEKVIPTRLLSPKYELCPPRFVNYSFSFRYDNSPIDLYIDKIGSVTGHNSSKYGYYVSLNGLTYNPASGLTIGEALRMFEADVDLCCTTPLNEAFSYLLIRRCI